MNIQCYAKIRNGVVDNLIMVDVDALPDISGCQLVPLGPEAEMGGGYENGKFTPRVKDPEH